MQRFLVLLALCGLTVASPQFFGVASQYRYQDALGQHAFGHVGGPNSREEVRSADGTTRGSYSYVDANGIVQSAVYSADAANGFRVAATNLPVGPAVPGAATVAAAPALVAAPAAVASPAVIAARYAAYPSAILGHPVVHALKKRDLVAVSQPATSYPGSTAPLVHAAPVVAAAAPVAYSAPLAYTAPVAHVATPLAYSAYSYGHPYSFAHVLKKRSVPADEPVVAHAKAAQLIQQNTEALRNNFGGVPLALPADTPEVAAGKIAHSIAHANEAARNAYVAPYAAYGAYGYAAPAAYAYAAAPVAPRLAYPFLY